MTIIRKRLLFIGLVALLGGSYSGLLAWSKLTTGVCSFGATCPYLFGLPVCVYGFAGFTIVLFLALYAYVQKDFEKRSLYSIYWISLFGSMFALYFLIQELFVLNPPTDGRKITLGYPSCLYGLVSFGVVFAISRNIINKYLEGVTKS